MTNIPFAPAFLPPHALLPRLPSPSTRSTFSQPCPTLTPSLRPHLHRSRVASFPIRWRLSATPSTPDNDPASSPPPAPSPPTPPPSVTPPQQQMSAGLASASDDLLIDDLLDDRSSVTPPSPPPAPPSSASSPPPSSTAAAVSTDELSPEHLSDPKSEKEAPQSQPPALNTDAQSDATSTATKTGTSTDESTSSTSTSSFNTTKAQTTAATPSPAPPASDPPSSKKPSSSTASNSSVKLSPDQVEAARAARQAAETAAAKSGEEIAARNKRILSTVQSVLTQVGDRTRAFELGRTARVRAEAVVDDAIAAGTASTEGGKDKPNTSADEQSIRLRGRAASVARDAVAALAGAWESRVVPFARQNLPDELEDISSRTLASATLGLFLAVVLFQPFFLSGGGSNKSGKTVEARKIDADTARLERKLNRDRATTRSSTSTTASSQKSVFPDDQTPGKSSSGSTTIEELTKSPSATQLPAKPTPPPPPPPVPAAPQPSRQAVAPPTTPKQDMVEVKDVTPEMVLSATKKKLGSDAGLATAVSFDSLSAEPTAVLTVTKAFHRLPAVDQRAAATAALQAVRSLGYERVLLVETDTNVEVASAGSTVVLDDETAALRAELRAVREQSDKLAIRASDADTEIASLRARIDEERDEFSAQRSSLEQSIDALRRDNSELAADLLDAKNEIARMPERLELEARTLEAEQTADKLRDTVEMLSGQLAMARNDQAAARTAAEQAEAKAATAIAQSDKRVSDAEARAARAEGDASQRADNAIATVRADTAAEVEAVRKQLQEAQTSADAAAKEAASSLVRSEQSSQKLLEEEQNARAKEVADVKSSYEKQLDEIGRKYKAEMEASLREGERRLSEAAKEARTRQTAVEKERDSAMKEVERTQTQAKRAAEKAAREKTGLEKKIGQLQAKLKGKEVEVVEEEPNPQTEEE